MAQPPDLQCSESQSMSEEAGSKMLPCSNTEGNEVLGKNEDKACNEHDYSTRLEVPLDAIKTELIEEPECILEELEPPGPVDHIVSKVPVVLPTPKIGNYSQRPNYPRQPKLPTLRPKLPEPKQFMIPPRQSLLLPRPIIPRMQLPPPIPPNIRSDQPPNCKGVLIVQDVKFCTMYVPKGDNTGPANSTTPHTIPIPVNALSKAVGVTPNVISSSASASLLSKAVGVTPNVINSSTSASLLSKAVGVTPNVISSSASASLLQTNPHKTQASGGAKSNSNDRTKTISTSYRAVINPKVMESSLANPLLWKVQNLLGDMLPIFWFSALEKNGINVMLLSYGTEKAIQRRMFVSCEGNVQISVHCKPIPDLLVERIVDLAGPKIRLTETTIKEFSDWIIVLIKILRDFHVCVGLEKREFRETFNNSVDIEVDKNPYQEVRFTETMRSVHCIRLVESSKRRCVECAKSLQSNRRRQNAKLSASLDNQKNSDDATKKNLRSNKKKSNVSRDTDSTTTDTATESDPEWDNVPPSPQKVKKRRAKQKVSKAKKRQESSTKEIVVETSNK